MAFFSIIDFTVVICYNESMVLIGRWRENDVTTA